MGLRSTVRICIRAYAILQPCPYVRVNLTVCSAMEEDVQGAHKVPGK